MSILPSKKTQRAAALVVIGASAGGMDALSRLLAQLPADYPAALCIVQHMSADATGEALLGALRTRSKLTCVQARHGDAIHGGHVYLARPDHHMLLNKGRIMITKGAQENRSRPAVDPLFRSAAVAYGNKVLGVLLTGYLDDGTAGLIAIQRCGGSSLVQLPADAAYPDMPQNALNQLTPDHCVPLAQMGAILVEFAGRAFRRRKPVPQDIAIEAKIATRVLSDLQSVEALGEQVPFNCPGCGGVLWQLGAGQVPRYRCHTGHAYTASVLWAEQTKKIEETLWMALRMFEERRNLLTTMAATQRGAGARSANERALQSEIYIGRIRAMLISSDNSSQAAPKRARNAAKA